MKIATHNGTFHADDVFGVALLKKLYPEAEFIRTRNETLLASADIVLDVGAIYDPATKRFDHHQQDAPKRENDITYSAFGLLWKEYGLEYCTGSHAVWKQIDKELVQFIDAFDNGNDLYDLNEKRVEPFDITDIIRIFNPLTLTASETFDKQFFKAVDLASGILERFVAKINDRLKGEELFQKAYQSAADKRFVVLDTYVPIAGIAEQYADILFVVYPSETGEQWMVQAVRKTPESFENRKPLPEAWASLRNEELAAITGVRDAVFCHTKRFIAGARTKEGAMWLLYSALYDEYIQSLRRDGLSFEFGYDAPGKKYSPHQHGYTRLLTLAGVVDIKYDETWHLQKPGDVCEIPSHKLHEAAVGEKGWTWVAAWRPEEEASFVVHKV